MLKTHGVAAFTVAIGVGGGVLIDLSGLATDGLDHSAPVPSTLSLSSTTTSLTSVAIGSQAIIEMNTGDQRGVMLTPGTKYRITQRG